MDALPLEEDERQRRELQRAFGVTPEEVARARWQRTTRDHWSLDAPSATGGSGPSLQGIGGAAAPGPPRSVADPGHLRHLAQVFRDAAEEASTAASDGTPVPGRGAAVALALAAAQGPSPGTASAGGPAPPEPGSGTSRERTRTGGTTRTGAALTVNASPGARPARSRSRRGAERRHLKAAPSKGHRRRRHARRAPSPPSSGPPSSTESDDSPSSSSSAASRAESTDSSDGSTSSSATGSDPGATRRRRRARAADKRPHRALVQEALRAFRREQREDTVVDPRFKGLLSPEWYRLAQRGGRLHLPRGNSIRGIRADVKALMHTSRQFAGDTPLGLVAFLGNFQTACDGSGLNEGTAVTLLQYFVTSEVVGVLQRAKDTHASRQLTYKRAVHALLNEYLDGDDLVDHLQALMQASQEKWEDEHEFANRILDANRALGSVLQEAELKSILLKDVGREVRALGRNFNTQGRTFPKLRTFLAKTGAATREARGVKLQAKPKGSASRSVGGEQREARRARPAASVALPVGAASAAAALSVTDYGTEAERAEWAAVLAASGTPVEYGSSGDVPVLPVDSLPHASGWQQQPAWGGRPELYPVHTGAGRGRGTLAPGTPVPPRAGTVFPHSDRPPRFPRGGAPPPRGGGWSGAPEAGPPPRRRGACSFCGHLGHWVWECPAQSPEVRAHGRALREAVAAHRNGRGPAPPAPLPLGTGPPVPPVPPTGANHGTVPPGTAAFVHAVETDDRAYPDVAGDEGESSSEEWIAGADGAGHGNGHTCHAQGNE